MSRRERPGGAGPVLSWLTLAVLLLWPLLIVPMAIPLDAGSPPITTTPSPKPTSTPAPAPTATATPEPPPLHVIRTYPIDGDSDVLPGAPIRIVFDQQVIETAIRVAITPTVPIELEWPAPDSLVLKAGPWQPGTEYRLTVAGARSRLGAGLGRPLSLAFSQGGGDGAPIPILMYHFVKALGPGATVNDRDCTVAPDAFAAQLDLLLQLGAHVVPLAQAVDYLSDGSPLPARPVVLTFDDGYEDVYVTAAPLLRVRNMTATIFVIPRYVGVSPYMSWEQLRELVAAGFTLGAHGYDHRAVNHLSPSAAQHEFGDARRWIEEMTATNVRFFAYPYGLCSPAAAEQAASQGYRAAVAVGPLTHQRRSQLLMLPRIHVGYGEPLEALRDRLPWKE